MDQIDAHHHFWNPARGDYGWIPDGDPILDRAYGPKHLAPELEAAGVTRTILVQAAASVEETEYMLGLADATDSIAGVVGWVNFEQRSHLHHMKRLARHPKFKGVRPMIQDIPDPNWMLRDDVQWAYQAISDLGLTFDALGFPQHLDNFLTLLKQYPDMRVVVDHCMKPNIAEPTDARFQQWADGMARIAGETGAFCKLSGMVTEASSTWTADKLRPYADHVLQVFSPSRVMWGSDWPVCRLRCEYGTWHVAAAKLTEGLDASEKDSVFRASAAEFYRLSN